MFPTLQSQAVPLNPSQGHPEWKKDLKAQERERLLWINIACNFSLKSIK